MFYLNISVLTKDNSIIIYDTLFSNDICKLVKYLKFEVRNCIINNINNHLSMNWHEEKEDINLLYEEFLTINTPQEINEKIKEYLTLENGEQILVYKLREFKENEII